MSALVLVTGPTLEPVSLAEAKDHLRIVDAEQDGLLSGYLLAARQQVEAFLGRVLLQQTFDFKVDFAWPRRCGYLSIDLPKPPAISVTSVSYVDANGVTQTLSAALYQLTQRNLTSVIVPSYGSSWPAVRWQYDAITVRYVAGYGTSPGSIPESIRQAILLLAAHFNENREPVVVGSTIAEFPFSVRALLSPYIAEF